MKQAPEQTARRYGPRCGGGPGFSPQDEAAPAAGPFSCLRPLRSRRDRVTIGVRFDAYGETRGQARRSVRVHRVRVFLRPLVREVPRLRRIRDAGRGGGRPGRHGKDAAGNRCCGSSTSRREGGSPDLNRRARARPRARRRSRAGLARPTRRRAGRRQVDAAADRARGRVARAAGAARDRRGVGRPGEAPRRAARRRGAGRDSRRDGARHRLRDASCRAAGRLRDRLRPDALLRRARLGAGFGRAGARGGGRGCCASRRRRGSRRCSSAT